MKHGQLVWTKFDDYPNWPSRIASEDVTRELREYKNTTKGVGVLFFGEELEYALVSEECIEPFEKCREKYTNQPLGAYKAQFHAALAQIKRSEEIVDPPLELEDRKRNRRSIKKKDEGQLEHRIHESVELKKDEMKTERETDRVKRVKFDETPSNEQPIATSIQNNELIPGIEGDIKEEIKEDVKEVKEEVKADIREDIKAEIKAEIKNDIKTEIQNDIKADIKTEIQNDIRDDIKTEIKDDFKTSEKEELTTDSKEIQVQSIAEENIEEFEKKESKGGVQEKLSNEVKTSVDDEYTEKKI